MLYIVIGLCAFIGGYAFKALGSGLVHTKLDAILAELQSKA